jgi:HlyD family secretion protein
MNGMDREIKKKNKFQKKHLWIIISIAMVLLIIYMLVFADNSSKLNVKREKISIAETRSDVFQDYIAVMGEVEPIRTIYLDAIEGGRVEEIHKEEGSMLKKGDVILTLSNTNLVLEISNNEAQVSRAINDLRTVRLSMIQQQLSLDRQIIDTKKDLQQFRRSYRNNKKMLADSLVPREDFLQSKELFEATSRAYDLLLETKKQDSTFRGTQLRTLENSVNRMERNLDIVRTRLDNLSIKAPVDGELATLNPEIGEVVNYGDRVGTINILDSYKLRVEIDEYFIDRVTKGLYGFSEFANKQYKARIVKIYPEVTSGRFAVDMVFTDSIPSQLRIGQTSRIRLELGESKEAILLPRGGFYQSTGGQWVYVVHSSGEYAYQREIKIGRQNPRYYEVISGLEPGEEVIVSSYDNFGEVDKLILKE